MLLRTSGKAENGRHDLPEAFGVALHSLLVCCRQKNSLRGTRRPYTAPHCFLGRRRPWLSYTSPKLAPIRSRPGISIYRGPWQRLPPCSACREESAPCVLHAGFGPTSARSYEDDRGFDMSLEKGDPARSEGQSLKSGRVCLNLGHFSRSEACFSVLS